MELRSYFVPLRSQENLFLVAISITILIKNLKSWVPAVIPTEHWLPGSWDCPGFGYPELNAIRVKGEENLIYFPDPPQFPELLLLSDF